MDLLGVVDEVEDSIGHNYIGHTQTKSRARAVDLLGIVDEVEDSRAVVGAAVLYHLWRIYLWPV